jgi:hypothetical protein
MKWLPVHMTGYGEGRVGEKIRTSLAYHGDQFISGTHGDLEALRSCLLVVKFAAEGSMKRKTYVVVRGTDDDALNTNSSD